MDNCNYVKMTFGVRKINKWLKYLPHKCEEWNKDAQKSLYKLDRYAGSPLILTWEGRDRDP